MSDPISPSSGDHNAEHAEHAEHAEEHVPLVVPPFSPRTLARHIRFDALLRNAVVVVAIGTAVFVMVRGTSVGVVATVFAVVILAAWLGLSALSAAVSRQLPHISMLIETDPGDAEALIVHQLTRRPLLRWVRLMIYHHLAMLRHHQHRYAESGAICRAILRYPLGPARQARPHLLLMLAHASLECGDPIGAYHALLDLYRSRLTLAESLQRLALQVRYEVMIGRPDAALTHARQTVELAELMPADQCGTVHALLAVAARRSQRHDLAQWLWGRAELLCTPEQLERIAAI